MKYGTHHLCTACYSALEPGRTPVQLNPYETVDVRDFMPAGCTLVPGVKGGTS